MTALNRRRLFLILLAAAVLIGCWLVPIDRTARTQIEAGLQRALTAFTAARVLGAAISVAQGTQVEKDVQVKADGKVLRQTDGRGVGFSADGIALSPDGTTLYWQAIKGKTLYSLPTAALVDAALTPQQLAARVVRVGENGVADGLLIGRDGRMYVTAPEEDAVKVRDNVNAPLRTLVRDARLRWPDTMAEGPDGAVYVTSSRIQDMSWFKPANPAALPTTLFRIEGR